MIIPKRRAQPGCVIDIETHSEMELPDVGGERYARHCGVTCLAYQLPGEPTRAWVPSRDADLPADLCAWVEAGGIVYAWNIPFDRAVWNGQLVQMGFPPLTLEQSHCIMARALYWGCPASLAQAGEALDLETVKDRTAHGLMLRMSRPRVIDPVTTMPRWWHLEDAEKLDRLVEYCVCDVDAEAEANGKIADLPPREREVWLMDQAMNGRGIQIDRDFVERMQAITADAQAALDNDCVNLTDGEVSQLSQRDRYLRWLQDKLGYPHDDLRRGTVMARLAETTSARERSALRLRAESARTSTAKLESMLFSTDRDDPRARGLVQYYGAGRTGRFAGRLVQPHNFPRPTIKTVADAVEQIGAGVDAETLAMFHDDSALGIVASCLRSCFVPAADKMFAVADLAQIEARVNPWLAGESDVLNVFRRGEDVYVHTARKIGSADRQLGKVLVLACGFGMGWAKFQETAKTYGLRLTEDAAREAVTAWRQANEQIVAFWAACDEAGREVAKAKNGFRTTVRGLLHFERWRDHLLIGLPAGRALVYRHVHTHTDDTGKESIGYYGVDQRTRFYGTQRTYGGKLVENIVQAVARDVLVDALLAVEQDDLLELVLHVHDETICEVPADRAEDGLRCLLAHMQRTPAWAPGLPVAAEGRVMARYGK